jgi:hypothetical protein
MSISIVLVLALEKTFFSQRVGVFPRPIHLGVTVPTRHATLKTTFEDEDDDEDEYD